MSALMQSRELRLGDDFTRATSGLFLPPQEVPAARPVGVDLFSGAGGFSCGFHQAGWHVAAAADGWATAACTYLVNLGGPRTQVHMIGDELPEGDAKQRAFFEAHRNQAVPANEFLASSNRGTAKSDDWSAGSGWIANLQDEPACEHFYLGDVRALTGRRILDDLDLADGVELAAIFGGPPCQGFSLAGQRDVMDPRSSLVFDFMRIVCEAHPQTFVMENVPGIANMLTPDGVPVIDAIARIAEDGNFGTFDAIRSSLLSHPDARAAMRTKPMGGNTKGHPGADRGRMHDRQNPAPAAEMSLFDEEEASS